MSYIHPGRNADDGGGNIIHMPFSMLGSSRPQALGQQSTEQLQIARYHRGRLSVVDTLQNCLYRPSGVGRLALGAPKTRQLGPLKAPLMGLGTWSWGNQFLWCAL